MAGSEVFKPVSFLSEVVMYLPLCSLLEILMYFPRLKAKNTHMIYHNKDPSTKAQGVLRNI